MRSKHPPAAFTLVEILVVISIIGILSAIAIPAVMKGLQTVKAGAIKLEVNSISEAIEQYKSLHNDYPPDFSSWSVIDKHYNKAFPRMTADERELLYRLVHSGGMDGDIATKGDNIFDATAIDRAESLVLAIGGLSKDIQRPLTGDGGPLAWVLATDYESATAAERQTPANYQYNADRVNRLHDFDEARLEIEPPGSTSAALSVTNKYTSADDGDLFPTYLARDEGAPFVYFDSRTYDHFDPSVSSGSGDFNGFASTDFGAVRPYFSDRANLSASTGMYASDSDALAAWEFMNPSTFQVVSAGLDDQFGTTATADVDSTSTDVEAIYFQYPTGVAIAPRTDVSTPGGLVVANTSKYQESTFGVNENFQLDNSTNFTESSTLDGDLP